MGFTVASGAKTGTVTLIQRFGSRAEPKEAAIIPPLCKSLICLKQTLLLYRWIPIEHQFAGYFQPLKDPRNRLVYEHRCRFGLSHDKFSRGYP